MSLDALAAYSAKLICVQKQVVAARAKGAATIRVSGQRHSQPPLVADDNRSDPPKTTTTYIVDMSCYVDSGNKGMVRVDLL